MHSNSKTIGYDDNSQNHAHQLGHDDTEKLVSFIFVCRRGHMQLRPMLTVHRGMFLAEVNRHMQRVKLVLIVSDVNGLLRTETTAFQKTNGSLAPLLYTQQLLPPSVKGSSLHEAVRQALQGQPTSWPIWVVGGPGVGHMASQVADLQRVFAVLSFTLPGPHFIYYGDEIGLAELQAQLHIRNSIFHLFQSLASLRLREVALRSSEFSLIPTNVTTVLAFSRSWRCSHFLVVLNFGESLTTELPVGLNSRWAVVLSSSMNRRDSVFPSTLFLAAREALVIKLAANERA
ncbi:SLC31 protein, partial [Polypterus senegalus]